MESVFPYGSESLGVKEHITSRKTLETGDVVSEMHDGNTLDRHSS